MDEQLKKFKFEHDELLKRYNYEIGGSVNFPRYNMLPIEVQLALKVLENHGVVYSATIRGKDKK